MKFLYFYLCLIPTDVAARSDQCYDDILFVPLIIIFLLVVAQYCNSFLLFVQFFKPHTFIKRSCFILFIIPLDEFFFLCSLLVSATVQFKVWLAITWDTVNF